MGRCTQLNLKLLLWSKEARRVIQVVRKAAWLETLIEDNLMIILRWKFSFGLNCDKKIPWAWSDKINKIKSLKRSWNFHKKIKFFFAVLNKLIVMTQALISSKLAKWVHHPLKHAKIEKYFLLRVYLFLARNVIWGNKPKKLLLSLDECLRCIYRKDEKLQTIFLTTATND